VHDILSHSEIQNTLELYTQEDSDDTRAVHGEFRSALGMSTVLDQSRGLSCWLEFPVTSDHSLELDGGDDRTRTRHTFQKNYLRSFSSFPARKNMVCPMASRPIRVTAP
jgi:hypothetical protein